MNWRTCVGPMAALLLLGCDASTSGERGGGSGGGEPPLVGDCASAAEATANVVYACDCQAGAEAGCVAGDDANTGATRGTGAAGPLRTWTAVRDAFGALPAGGTVALCKGGSWGVSANTWFQNVRCTAASPCTLREYQAPWGGASRPRVNASATPLAVTGSATPTRGYRIWNLSLVGPRGNGSAGVFGYGAVSDVDLCNLEIAGFQIGVQLADFSAGNTPPAGQSSFQARVTLRNSWIHDNGNFADQTGDAGDGWLGSCDGCTVDANLFENNGVSSPGHATHMFNHQIYMSGYNTSTAPAVGMRITNNRFWTHGVDCEGARVVGHWQFRDILYENNLIENGADVTMTGDNPGGCWAFGYGPGGYACPITYEGFVFRRNRVVGNFGNTGLTIEASTGAVFEDNLIVLSGAGAVAMQIPAHAQAACPRGAGGTYPANTGTIVRNNTIHLQAGGTGVLFGVDEGSGHVVANNAVLSGAAGFDCVRTVAAMAYDGSNWCGIASPFVFTAVGDYRPLPGGPLVGAGSAAYASPQALGSVQWSAGDAGRARGGAIDVGAFQR